MSAAKHRSGFVAFVGRPNVGKSTLLNALLGRQIAITSDKPQTTRNRIIGVLTRPEMQAILVDTPGIHKPKHKLGQMMTATAKQVLGEVDLVCHIVDAGAELGAGEEYIIEHLKQAGAPTVLVVNKCDLTNREAAMDLAGRYLALFDYDRVVYISALQAANLEELVSLFAETLPAGPEYYPPEMITDQPELFVVAELVREQVFRATRDEIPHSTAVIVDEVGERPGDLLFIRAFIYVERESQKQIVIGTNGQMISAIGRAARASVEAFLGQRVYLDLWVKVNRDWRNNPASLRKLGYDREEDE